MNLDEDHKESILKKVRSIEKDLEKTVINYQKNALEHYPFIFLGLSTFGGVAVFYGFEKIIDQTSYLADKPLVILISGFLILVLTGALYRKLN
ncbi:MAG: hypothetical protein ACI870_000083 [Crocinitomicaceae bacterium]|jgi:hypothetical protein